MSYCCYTGQKVQTELWTILLHYLALFNVGIAQSKNKAFITS